MSFPNRFVLQNREKCSYMRVLSRGGNKVEDLEDVFEIYCQEYGIDCQQNGAFPLLMSAVRHESKQVYFFKGPKVGTPEWDALCQMQPGEVVPVDSPTDLEPIDFELERDAARDERDQVLEFLGDRGLMDDFAQFLIDRGGDCIAWEGCHLHKEDGNDNCSN